MAKIAKKKAAARAAFEGKTYLPVEEAIALVKANRPAEAHAPLAELTWFRVGGNADVLFIPADAEDLVQAMVLALDRIDATRGRAFSEPRVVASAAPPTSRTSRSCDAGPARRRQPCSPDDRRLRSPDRLRPARGRTRS